MGTDGGINTYSLCWLRNSIRRPTTGLSETTLDVGPCLLQFTMNSQIQCNFSPQFNYAQVHLPQKHSRRPEAWRDKTKLFAHADRIRNLFYLRVVEVDRCRSVEQRWCEHDGTYLEDRCHVCGGDSVLCKQAGTTRTDRTGGGGRTSSLLSLPVAAVCCLYLQTNATPSPYSHSPHVRWTFPASSLFPKEFYFPKVGSHSLGYCQQRANPDSIVSMQFNLWWAPAGLTEAHSYDRNQMKAGPSVSKLFYFCF